MMQNSIIKSVCVCVCFCQPRLLRPAARRYAPLNQTWGPMISALWVHSHGTLNCQTLTATGRPSILVLVSANPKQRTTRNLLPQSRSSPLLPKELTCTRELSSLSPSSSLMWFTGLYICDYLQMILYYRPPPTHTHRHKFLNYQSELKEMWNLPIQNDFWESLYITIIVIFNLKKTHTLWPFVYKKKSFQISLSYLS